MGEHGKKNKAGRKSGEVLGVTILWIGSCDLWTSPGDCDQYKSQDVKMWGGEKKRKEMKVRQRRRSRGSCAEGDGQKNEGACETGFLNYRN